jgi:phosphopantetheinyl transferase (holo-ACP synthase)
LFGKALSLVASLGANAWHVTITHDAGVAAAVVILEKR